MISYVKLYNDYIIYCTFYHMNERTGLDNTTYDILSALGREADFLYDTIDKYIDDAKQSNNNELVDLWNRIKQDRLRHIDDLKEALERAIHK
jgi:hypothetical protein